MGRLSSEAGARGNSQRTGLRAPARSQLLIKMRKRTPAPNEENIDPGPAATAPGACGFAEMFPGRAHLGSPPSSAPAAQGAAPPSPSTLKGGRPRPRLP